jgi:hypothetical protein
VRFGGAASYVQDLYELCNIWLPQAETERIITTQRLIRHTLKSVVVGSLTYYHKIREMNIVRPSSYTKKKEITNVASTRVL